MRRRGGDTASVPLSSPTGSSSVQVHHDCQLVAFRRNPGNGPAMENDSHTRRELLTGQGGASEINLIDESVLRKSFIVMESSSQVHSGPEDNTDPHESLTESSTITYVDAYTTDESMENHSVQGLGSTCVREFVLIDDDEDGDMSLREKTVTDLSAMDGRAADLVCGRLLSTSSGSLSETKEEASAHEAAPPEQVGAASRNKSCCFCTVL
uniref:Si:ch211-12e13.12 n=1 Tax=Iconisemion striatum TaxID=60296 RepID=A0A1A7X7Z8_9TELE